MVLAVLFFVQNCIASHLSGVDFIENFCHFSLGKRQSFTVLAGIRNLARDRDSLAVVANPLGYHDLAMII